MQFIDQQIEEYCLKHTQKEPDYLQELIAETYASMNMPHMLCGRGVGRLLKFLVASLGAKSVIEIGTFTGYSALSMAEGLVAGGKLVTCDVDPKALKIAKKYISKSPYANMIDIKLGPALDTLASLKQDFDFAFIDADKENYPNYYNACLEKLKRGGIIVIDNSLWRGEVMAPLSPEAWAIARLNELIARDERVENVLLAVRDGVNVIRKR